MSGVLREQKRQEHQVAVDHTAAGRQKRPTGIANSRLQVSYSCYINSASFEPRNKVAAHRSMVCKPSSRSALSFKSSPHMATRTSRSTRD